MIVRDSRHVDAEGVDWQMAAAAALQAAAAAGQDPPQAQLPQWQRSPFVTREVFGHYALIGGQVHDVRTATPACGIDASATISFAHFYHEVRELFPDAVCHECVVEPPEVEP